MIMKTAKSKSLSKAELNRKIVELEAQLASSYHFADATLHKASNLMGSGVLLQLNALGGRQLINPIVIRDGLSPETVDAIRRDINRSYEIATLFKPKGSESK